MMTSTLFPYTTLFRSDALGEAFTAAAAYVEEVAAVLVAGTPLPAPAIVARRRALGVALNAAELALDRLIAERAANSAVEDRKSTRLNSSHSQISYAVF